MHTHLIYSIRMGAWLAASGTGTSDWREAKRFTHNSAYAMAVRQRSHDGQFGAIIVRLEDLEQLAAETPFPGIA